MAGQDDFEHKKMRDDIYEQLRARYLASPESMSDGAKAILAILSTTRYMDLYDAKGDMFADMERRLKLAEKLMDMIEDGTSKDPYKDEDLIMDLIPLEMIETVLLYEHPDGDMYDRMQEVWRRKRIWSTHDYEKKHGLPLTDFSDPIDKYFEHYEVASDFDDLLEG